MLRSLAEVQSDGKLQDMLQQVLFQEDETGVDDGTGRRLLYYLTRLQQTILQSAVGLGAHIQEPDLSNAPALTGENSSNTEE